MPTTIHLTPTQVLSLPQLPKSDQISEFIFILVSPRTLQYFVCIYKNNFFFFSENLAFWGYFIFDDLLGFKSSNDSILYIFTVAIHRVLFWFRKFEYVYCRRATHPHSTCSVESLFILFIIFIATSSLHLSSLSFRYFYLQFFFCQSILLHLS